MSQRSAISSLLSRRSRPLALAAMCGPSGGPPTLAVNTGMRRSSTVLRTECRAQTHAPTPTPGGRCRWGRTPSATSAEHRPAEHRGDPSRRQHRWSPRLDPPTQSLPYTCSNLDHSAHLRHSLQVEPLGSPVRPPPVLVPFTPVGSSPAEVPLPPPDVPQHAATEVRCASARIQESTLLDMHAHPPCVPAPCWRRSTTRHADARRRRRGGSHARLHAQWRRRRRWRRSGPRPSPAPPGCSGARRPISSTRSTIRRA